MPHVLACLASCPEFLMPWVLRMRCLWYFHKIEWQFATLSHYVCTISIGGTNNKLSCQSIIWGWVWSSPTRAPGKNAASMKPRKNLVRRAPTKLQLENETGLTKTTSNIQTFGWFLKKISADLWDSRVLLACQAWYSAPDDYARRKIQRWFSNPVQKHVSIWNHISMNDTFSVVEEILRGYLHNDVPHIQYR